MSELEEDIKHCEEVLADWHGCDECKADHERQTTKGFYRI